MAICFICLGFDVSSTAWFCFSACLYIKWCRFMLCYDNAVTWMLLWRQKNICVTLQQHLIRLKVLDIRIRNEKNVEMKGKAWKTPEYDPVYSRIRSYMEIICPNMVKYGTVFRRFCALWRYCIFANFSDFLRF